METLIKMEWGDRTNWWEKESKGGTESELKEEGVRPQVEMRGDTSRGRGNQISFY